MFSGSGFEIVPESSPTVALRPKEGKAELATVRPDDPLE